MGRKKKVQNPPSPTGVEAPDPPSAAAPGEAREGARQKGAAPQLSGTYELTAPPREAGPADPPPADQRCANHVIHGGDCGADGDDCDGCDHPKPILPPEPPAAAAGDAPWEDPLPAHRGGNEPRSIASGRLASQTESLAEALVGALAPAPPARLPVPRAADVDLSLIDVVSNVRSSQTLFHEDLSILGHSLAAHQIETLKLIRLPGGRYRLLDGERRYRAAMAQGLASLRAEVYDQPLDDAQVLWFQLLTFASRRDLNHGERARALAAYAEKTGLSASGIAKSLGMGDDDVRKHLAYLKCHATLREEVDRGRLSLNKALLIARLPSAEQESMAERAWLHGMSEAALSESVNAALGKTSGGLLSGIDSAGGTGVPPVHSISTGEMPAPPAKDSGDTPMQAPSGVCQICGCDEQHPCPGGCGWENEARTLCTSCHERDGRDQELVVLVRFGLDRPTVDRLGQCGVETVGDLAALTTRKGTFWHQDIKGIGQAAAERVADAVAQFHFARVGKWVPESALTNAGRLSGGTGVPPVASDVTDGPEVSGDRSTGPTAEHDLPNARRKAKADEAPVRGTKAQTNAEREAQAKSDSDARVPGPTVFAARWYVRIYRTVNVRTKKPTGPWRLSLAYGGVLEDISHEKGSLPFWGEETAFLELNPSAGIIHRLPRARGRSRPQPGKKTTRAAPRKKEAKGKGARKAPTVKAKSTIPRRRGMIR